MTNFGLPFEYQTFPEFFDALNIQDETESKNQIIEKILRKYNVKSVLDLTCGTGSQVFYLSKLGYDVIGADFSPELLKTARKKSKEENLNLKFIDGDMRNIQVGKFDGAITIFNAIGHLSKEDFAKAIKNIRKNLNDDGIYIFDIFNSKAMKKRNISELDYQVKKKIGSIEFENQQFSEFDESNGILTCYNNFSIKKPSEEVKKFKNKFSLQIYDAKELHEILTENGFVILEQLTFDESEFRDDESADILTVAKIK